MNKYDKRLADIIAFFKPIANLLDLENDKQLEQEIKFTINNSVDKTALMVGKRLLKRQDLTYEIEKYLIGKVYRTEYNLNRQNCNSYYDTLSYHYGENSCTKSQDVFEYVGREYHISGSSVCKYDLYARAIDTLACKKSIQISDILCEKLRIPADYVIKLSKMTDDDIKYLRFLFLDNFYKLAGYIMIKDKSNADDLPVKSKGVALIKKMPEHDPDALVSSLSFTIPSWINTIQRTMSTTDITAISDDAREVIQIRLNELKYTATKMLTIIEGENNE